MDGLHTVIWMTRDTENIQSFKKVFKQVSTGMEEVSTNQIEGAWKHAKDHFHHMSGTKVRQYEGHLAENMWRSVQGQSIL